MESRQGGVVGTSCNGSDSPNLLASSKKGGIPYKRYFCDFCEKTFSKRDQLEEHRFSHTGERPFVCELCGIHVRNKSSLRRHKKVHGSQKHQCSVCEAGFANESSLKYHMRKRGIHENLKRPAKEEPSSGKGELKDDEVGGGIQMSCSQHRDILSTLNASRKFELSPERVTPRTDRRFAEESIEEHSYSERQKVPLYDIPVYRGTIDIHIQNKELCLSVKGHESGDSESGYPGKEANLSVKDGATSALYVPSSMNIKSQPAQITFRSTQILIDFSFHDTGSGILNDFGVNADGSTVGNNNSDMNNIRLKDCMKNIAIHRKAELHDAKAMEKLTRTTKGPQAVPASNIVNSKVHKQQPEKSQRSFEKQSIDSHVDMTEVHPNWSGLGTPGRGEDTNVAALSNKTSTYVARFGKDVSIKKVEGEVQYACGRCDITCYDQQSMKDHIRSKVHNTFVCNICAKLFYTRPRLFRHIRTHTSEKPYQCDTCGKAFICKSSLTVHKVSHSAKRPHYCTVCGRGFTNTGDLHQHTRIHTGEKIYQCETCGVSFTHRSTLRRHVSLHTGYKPFKCDKCDKSYPGLSELKRHLVSHSGERRYPCKVCEKSYFTFSHLSRHQKKHCEPKKDAQANKTSAERVEETGVLLGISCEVDTYSKNVGFSPSQLLADDSTNKCVTGCDQFMDSGVHSSDSLSTFVNQLTEESSNGANDNRDSGPSHQVQYMPGADTPLVAAFLGDNTGSRDDCYH